MPYKPSKARKLLRDKKAKVVKRELFTIQLLYGSSGYKQDISLGIDAGSKHIGTSATTTTKELYASERALQSIFIRINLLKILFFLLLTKYLFYGTIE